MSSARARHGCSTHLPDIVHLTFKRLLVGLMGEHRFQDSKLFSVYMLDRGSRSFPIFGELEDVLMMTSRTEGEESFVLVFLLDLIFCYFRVVSDVCATSSR